MKELDVIDPDDAGGVGGRSETGREDAGVGRVGRGLGEGLARFIDKVDLLVERAGHLEPFTVGVDALAQIGKGDDRTTGEDRAGGVGVDVGGVIDAQAIKGVVVREVVARAEESRLDSQPRADHRCIGGDVEPERDGDRPTVHDIKVVLGPVPHGRENGDEFLGLHGLEVAVGVAFGTGDQHGGDAAADLGCGDAAIADFAAAGLLGLIDTPAFGVGRKAFEPDFEAWIVELGDLPYGSACQAGQCKCRNERRL